MEAFRPKKSPLSDRLFGSFAASETLETAVRGNDGGELDEREVFCVGTDFYSKSFPSDTENHSSASATMSPSGSFRLLPSVQSFGILAALPDDIKSQKKMPVRSNSFMQRKSSMSSMNTTSTSPSSSSARVMIPKPKSSEYNGGEIIFPQSAPMNVPVVSRESERNRNWWGEVDYEYVSDADDDEEDEGMLPPHEIVARASLRNSPMTTFSVLEGVGRTLKGSDLRRVRNAVWRQTGFLD